MCIFISCLILFRSKMHCIDDQFLLLLCRSFSGYGDELAWSAIWLYRATGDTKYETRAKALWDEYSIQYSGYGFGWDNKFSGVQVNIKLLLA